MTKIEWADEVWNPIVGCNRESPECDHCYAERMARRLAHLPKYRGLTDEKGWTGLVRLDPESLIKPFRWKAPRWVFVNSMGDLFHEAVRKEWLALVWEVMRVTDKHTYLVLTKRDRDWWAPITLPNLVIGVSIGIAINLTLRRMDRLMGFNGHRWLNYEPAIGPLPWRAWYNAGKLGKLCWVTMGGETGPGARQCWLEWFEEAIHWCRKENVPVFVKPLGDRPVGNLLAQLPKEFPMLMPF